MIVSSGILGFAAFHANVRRMSSQSALLRPRTEIAILGLEHDKLRDEIGDKGFERFITCKTPNLHGTCQILASKFTGPWDQVAKRTTVAIAKHFQHGRIAQGRDFEPLLGDPREIISHAAGDFESGARNAIGLRGLSSRLD